MNEQIKHAFDEYRKAVQAEQSLSSAIQERDDKRPTPEDQEQFERIDADIDLWKKETERLLKVAERSKEVDAIRDQFAALFTQDDKVERVATKSDSDRLVDLNKRFKADGVLTGFDAPYNPLHDIEMGRRYSTRALSTPGGTAIDVTFIDRVHFYAIDESPMLDPAIVNVFSTNRGETMEFPRLTADPSVAGTLTAEAGGLTEADPTLSKVSLSAYKYGGISLWSAELDEDNVIGIQAILARSLGRHIGEQVNGPLTTGDGNNKPNGIITAAANGGTATGTANSTFFGWPDLVDLVHGRKPSYRRNGQWLVSTTALAKIRKFQNSNGDPIFIPALAAGQPETLLGYPVHENPDMAAAGSASKSVLFGDTQLYMVRRVGPARVELSRDYRFSTDELAIKVVERLDGDLLDANAVAYLVSANA